MKVALDTAIDLFDDHLNKVDNKYILVSAPFGYGKTYFLRDYFERNSDKYKPFWLSPVKYAVGQNEDIFEYIKIDIAIHLLSQPELVSDNKPDFSDSLIVQQYLHNNLDEATKILFLVLENMTTVVDDPTLAVVAGVSKMAKPVVDFLEKYAKKKYEFLKWRSDIKKASKSKVDDLLSYASKQDQTKGSIFEEDAITQAIALALKIIKLQNPILGTDSVYRENVLIIDDFDRLDPDHIFRILNILSVHRNFTNGDDKFGFDKIVVVCSIDNVRNVYRHKYGSNVDFDGYMEKFYST